MARLSAVASIVGAFQTRAADVGSVLRRGDSRARRASRHQVAL